MPGYCLHTHSSTPHRHTLNATRRRTGLTNEEASKKSNKVVAQRKAEVSIHRFAALLGLLCEDVPMLVIQSIYLHAVGFREDNFLIVLSPLVSRRRTRGRCSGRHTVGVIELR